MAKINDPENTVVIELKDGSVTIELLADIAPKHVTRMKELARSGQYDNVAFHRVIPGFMAQTGDVKFGNSNSENFDLDTVGKLSNFSINGNSTSTIVFFDVNDSL